MTSTTHHRPRGEATVAPPSADLTTYYLIHRALREAGARLAFAVEGCEPGTDPARTRAIARWYRGLDTELHAHHRTEDTIHFPALAERVPVMASHEERLADEHHQLDATMLRVSRALTQLADVPVTESSHGEAIAATRQLSHLLDVHLSYEDADILPLFVRHFTAEEYRVLDEQTTKGASIRALAFTVPFIVEAATPEELAHIMAEAPRPLKVLLVLCRGRYRRLTQAAFG